LLESFIFFLSDLFCFHVVLDNSLDFPRRVVGIVLFF